MLIYNTEIFLRVCSKFSHLSTYFLVETFYCQFGKVFTIFTSLMEGKERKGRKEDGEGRKEGKEKERREDSEEGRKEERKERRKAGRKKGMKERRKKQRKE